MALANKARDIRQQVAGRLSETLRQGPLSPATNHDLQRVLALAFRDAALSWLAEIENIPRHDLSQADRNALPAFDTRARRFIEARGHAAEDRAKPFEDVVAQEVMTGVIAAVPEATVATADLATTCAALATAFRETLEARDGEGLPEAARTQLERCDADGLNRFGKRVLDTFIERLKSSAHREAARAFDHRVGGEIRRGLQEVREILAKSDDNVQAPLAALDALANRIDGIALSLAKVEENTDTIRDLSQRIDQRLAARGRLALDRKRAIEIDRTSFVQLTFRQRTTRVVGREQELAQLRAFLEDEAAFSWWQIAGEGGQGKSRLALHLVDELDAAWDAGFIDAEELEGFDWRREPFAVPTLCIVDYAAAPQKAASVVKAITALARRGNGSIQPPLGAPVRLLVLERVSYAFGDGDGASADLNWLWAVNADAEHSALLQASVRKSGKDAAPPLTVRPLADDEMIAVANSWRAFAEKPPLAPDVEARLLNTLRGRHLDPSKRSKAWRPLFAMMYASLIGEGATESKALAHESDIETLLRNTLENERSKNWPHHADAPDRPKEMSAQAGNLACLATMIGGIDAQRLFKGLVQTDAGAAELAETYGDLRGADGRDAFCLLGFPPVALDPEGAAAFPAREPDLLGEYMVLWCLRDAARPDTRARALARIETLIRHAATLDNDMLFAFLTHLLEDFPGHKATQALTRANRRDGDHSGYAANRERYDRLETTLNAAPSGGADVDIDEDSHEDIALLLASQNGHADYIKHLLNADADPNAVDPNTGAFPLLMAAHNGHADCVALLLKAGANPNTVDPNTGAFPLLLAAQNGHADCVDLLLNANAEPNAVNPETGTFPLLMAAHNGHADCVALLLKAGADPNTVDPNTGAFPLLMAAQNGHADCVALLLKAGADPNTVDPNTGAFPLLLAAQNGHADCVALLLKAGADPNTVDPNTGAFPLLMAAQNGHADCVALLLKAGADPNTVDPNTGAFPLLLAAHNGHAESVTLLLIAGADPNVVNSETGAFPLLRAYQQGHFEVVRILQEAGTKSLGFLILETERANDPISARRYAGDWALPPPVEPKSTWRELAPGDIAEGPLLARWAERNEMPGTTLLKARSLEVPCLPGGRVLECLIAPSSGADPGQVVFLSTSGILVHLAGQSGPFHVLGQFFPEARAVKTQAEAASWLRLFCAALSPGDSGTFQIVESLGDLPLSSPGAEVEGIETLQALVGPLSCTKSDETGMIFNATVTYARALFRATFHVAPDGKVEMTDDEMLADNLPLFSYGFEGPFRRRW